MPAEEFTRKLTAILSADVAGYSRLMVEDEAATVKTLHAHQDIMTTLILQHRGRVIDSPGDNLLAEFASVVNAVECAVQIQEEIKVRNAELPETRKMEFRIGINVGDVIEDGERIYGDGVNIAARMEELAEAGGICISGPVYDQVKNKVAVKFESAGEHAIKNIADPIRVYCLRLEYETAVPTVAAVMILKGKSPSDDQEDSLLFVSYVCGDNQPPPSADEGWVTTLIKRLKTLLSQKLSREEAYSLWIDSPLHGNVQVTSEILEAIQHTAILVVILSRNYIASDCCQREKNSFLSMVKERARRDSSVFVIERDRLEYGEWPPEFNEVTGHRYPFWDELRYHTLLNDLSYDLADELRRRKTRTEILTKDISPVSDDRPVVLLADVTDDLYLIREEVEQYLTQANLRVLPEEGYYPYETAAFQQTVHDDLAKSDLFVQLLSGVTGKKPKNFRQSRARCQYELALEAGKPIVQWRSPELDVATIQDDDQRALLQLDTVLAVEIDAFQSEIVNRIIPKKPSPPSLYPDIGILLFLDANISEDSTLVTQICQVFDQFGVGYMLPLQSEKPSENREAFEQYVLHCDALVIVYGEVSVKWVSDQLLAIRKIFWKRQQPLRAFAIFDGPPPEKPPVNIKLPNMRILHCRDGVDEEKLVNFIESLPQEKTLV